jgi:hypothetical protein
MVRAVVILTVVIHAKVIRESPLQRIDVATRDRCESFKFPIFGPGRRGKKIRN